MILNFPIIRNVKAKSISDSIYSTQPISFSEVVNGRNIEQVQHNYQEFKSETELILFIIQKLNELGWNKEWLTVSKHYSNMILNNDPDTFYDDKIGCLTISALHFTDIFDDLPTGGDITYLDPRKWDTQTVEKLINEIKNIK